MCTTCSIQFNFNGNGTQPVTLFIEIKMYIAQGVFVYVKLVLMLFGNSQKLCQ